LCRHSFPLNSSLVPYAWRLFSLYYRRSLLTNAPDGPIAPTLTRNPLGPRNWLSTKGVTTGQESLGLKLQPGSARSRRPAGAHLFHGRTSGASLVCLICRY
jgi:hypothetical protein